MNTKQAQAALIKFFDTEWNDLTPVAYPDVEFKTPNTAWARFETKYNQTEQKSIGATGSNKFRTTGILIIQIFTRKGQGSVDAWSKANAAMDIFLTQTLEGITFKRVKANPIGQDNAGWYQINVTAEFQFDRHL